MAKLIVVEFMTLDGVIEAPENWQFPYHTPEVLSFNQQQIHSLSAILLGRATYDIFAPAWSQRTNNEFGMSDKINAVPKYVISQTLESVDWNGTTLINENIADTIRQIKQDTEGIIGVIGSGKLVEFLASENLIDEYQLQIYPTVVGKGQRLFTDGFPNHTLNLVDSKTIGTNVVLLMYQPVG